MWILFNRVLMPVRIARTNSYPHMKSSETRARTGLFHMERFSFHIANHTTEDGIPNWRQLSANTIVLVLRR